MRVQVLTSRTIRRAFVSAGPEHLRTLLSLLVDASNCVGQAGADFVGMMERALAVIVNCSVEGTLHYGVTDSLIWA